MAHRITSIDMQEALSMAWHQLTKVRKFLGLDKNWLTTWDVVPAPIFLEGGRKLPFVQLVCTDNPDILVGSPYNPATFCPVTNAAFLEMIRNSISGTDHKVVSIGSVRGRGRTFVSLEMVGLEKFKAAGRSFAPFLNYGNGHDRSSVLWVNTSNTCTVCDNTFSFNLASIEQKEGDANRGDDLAHSQRHTRHISSKLPDISKLVDKAVGVQAEFAAAFEAMAEKKVQKATAEALFTSILVKPDSQKIVEPTRNKIDRLVHLFAKGKGNKGQNRADAFSAVTDYYTHESSGASASPEQQFVTSEFGTGATYKQRAFSVLTDDEKFEKAVTRGNELLSLVTAE